MQEEQKKDSFPEQTEQTEQTYAEAPDTTPECTPDVKQDAQEKQQKKKKPDRAASELKKLTDELAKQKEQMLRTVAEYDNYRKRTEKEKAQSVEYGICSAVAAILSAIDNLERAAAVETADSEYKKGVEMTLRQFHSALESLGVSEIPALNMPFDPTVHSAVAQLEKPDTESGTVTQVLQKGYRASSGRVVRHCMVAVQP